MNIFLHELKAIRKSTLLWTCSLVAIASLFLAMFPGLSSDAEDFKQVLAGYPVALRDALGMSLETITTLMGFYTFAFTYILVASSIQAMNLGTSILSKEIREKTADFLLTKPVSRTQILTAKLLAAITSLLITQVVYLLIVSIIAVSIQDATFELGTFLLISLTAFLVQLIFLSIGYLFSVLLPRIRSVLAISVGTVIGFFMITLFGSAVGDKAIRLITPFKLYDTSYIRVHSSYEGFYILVEVIFVAIILLTSYVIYLKKDIHAV
ncbi:ABC transporter permease [Paenibacillus psychroresistens]|uniref:ABC transporter permease n=1 Tax=Paenibacillus psychroresistens TaxID=1778678 RepID=A0A6B8RG11_9BACL|nr:ABC transporter permease subunit [Paenibacillus psychroresistens]QGQ94463.1 ABC transporter permease [Paenibacillus psychroresistens]